MPDPNQKPEPMDLPEDSPIRRLFEDAPGPDQDELIRRLRETVPLPAKKPEPVDA